MHISIGKIALAFIDSTLNILSVRDKYSAEHCKSVGRLAAELGTSFGLDLEYISELQLAGRAHDIGKLTWPDMCFTEKTKDELGACFDMMYFHPTHSKKFLQNSFQSLDHPKCSLRWIEWVWLHHWGYKDEYKINPPLEDPEVKKLLECIRECPIREIIELGIGIIHVSDAFHAAISGRPYRKDHPKPKSIDQVIYELRDKSGEEYHPEVVKKIKSMESWLRQIFIPDIYYR